MVLYGLSMDSVRTQYGLTLNKPSKINDFGVIL
jgi:hypothetical protein